VPFNATQTGLLEEQMKASRVWWKSHSSEVN
jgi:hypothetical protein